MPAASRFPIDRRNLGRGGEAFGPTVRSAGPDSASLSSAQIAAEAFGCDLIVLEHLLGG